MTTSTTFRLAVTPPGSTTLSDGGYCYRYNEGVDARWTFPDGMDVHLSTPVERTWVTRYDRHSTPRRELERKARVYVSDDRPFNVLEDLENRFRRPAQVYRPHVEDALARIGVDHAGLRWSQRAGCSCGCSPGFVVDSDIPGIRGCDLWVTVPAVPTVDESKPGRVIA
jgi:hypothetical protein